MPSKEEYIRKIHAKIDEWDADMDKLREKAQRAESKFQSEVREQIDTLKSKRKEIAKKISELNSCAGDAWKDIAAGIDLSMESMGSAIRSALSRFR
jgi:uncharacterized coiled-coil DUF342 family protein